MSEKRLDYTELKKSLFIVNKIFFGYIEINLWLLLTNFSRTKSLKGAKKRERRKKEENSIIFSD